MGVHSHDDREPIPEEGEITVVEEALEPIVEDDEDENEPHLQENGMHSQEISEERKSFSCCLQLRSQILGNYRLLCCHFFIIGKILISVNKFTA